MRSVVGRNVVMLRVPVQYLPLETFKPAIYEDEIKKKKFCFAENILRLHFKDQTVNTPWGNKSWSF